MTPTAGGQSKSVVVIHRVANVESPLVTIVNVLDLIDGALVNRKVTLVLVDRTIIEVSRLVRLSTFKLIDSAVVHYLTIIIVIVVVVNNRRRRSLLVACFCDGSRRVRLSGLPDFKTRPNSPTLEIHYGGK